MRRTLPSVTIDDRSQRWFRRTRAILLAVPMMAFSPVVYELVLVLVMRWKELFGVGMKVDTPILDSLASFTWSGRYEILHQTHAFFHQGTWSAPLVMGFALFWTVALAVLLRRC